MPGGLSVFVDDQPESVIIWVLREDYSRRQVAVLEASLNAASRQVPVKRATLRAV